MCEGDTALRARVDALLAARERSEPLPATQAETAGPTIKLDLADAPEEARRDFAQARTQLKLALGDKPGHDRGPNWPFTYQAETRQREAKALFQARGQRHPAARAGREVKAGSTRMMIFE